MLHPAQAQIVNSQKRFRVVDCGRRFGKTTLVAEEMCGFAHYRPKTLSVYLAPTITQARDIAWSMFKEKTKGLWNKEPNETRMEIEVRSVNGEISRIWLRGTENVQSLRGLGINFLAPDEVSSMNNWKSIWAEVLRPTLTDTKGQALFTSTPKGYDHFYELYNMEKKDPDYQSFKFTSYDNPHLPVDEINKARLELDEDTFAQEYLAEFKKYTGLVYKDFSREVHVITPIELKSNWSYYRAVDFGFVHPTAVLFAAISDKGILYIFDEIYSSGLQTPDLAELIKQKSVGRMYLSTIADSAQQSDIGELSRYGLGVTPVSKTSGSQGEDWTKFKIRKVTEKLRGRKIYVFNNCVNTIREFESYKYHEVNKYGQVTEVPVKIDDHAMDALAYMIVSLPDRVDPVYDVNYDKLINQLPDDHLFNKYGFY